MDSNFNVLDNATLSIDLSTSWTNYSVIINTIAKDPSVPRLNMGVLWKDPNETAFYQWAGQVSNIAIDYPPPILKLWKFTVDESGSSWSVLPESSIIFDGLVRQTYGWGLTVRDTSFYLGGYLCTLSDVSSGAEATTIPGITSLNLTSGIWITDSTAGLNSQGTIAGQKVLAITASGVDQRDILVIIGGLDSCSSCGSDDYTSFNSITLYDPYINAWFAQQATGAAPSPREGFCAVSVKGDNGTYEM